MAEERMGPDRVENASAAPSPATEERVQTLICVKCGTEYYFSGEGPPGGISCEKCGNTIFRSFDSDAGDEVADDFRDSTERDLHPDDAEGDALPGDVLDLNPE